MRATIQGLLRVNATPGFGRGHIAAAPGLAASVGGSGRCERERSGAQARTQMADTQPGLCRVIGANFRNCPNVGRLPEFAQHLRQISGFQALGDIPIGPQHDAVTLERPAFDHVAVIGRESGTDPDVSSPIRPLQSPSAEGFISFTNQQA